MAFKMNGSPAKMGTISGTAGHSSALKQLVDVEQQKANMKKTTEARKEAGKGSGKKPYVKKGGKATGSMKDYAIGSKERYDEYEARGWAHDDTTKGYKPKASKVDAKYVDRNQKITAKGDTKIDKIEKKAAKGKGEVMENVDRKLAKSDRKQAKKVSGKGSKEHLTAKKTHLQAKEADRQGERGGKKQGFFRKLSSKINKRRQAKIDKKLAE
jgi:hypothetical protein